MCAHTKRRISIPYRTSEGRVMSRHGFGRRRTVLQLEDGQNKRDNYGLGYRPAPDRQTRDPREGNPIGALDMMMHYDDSEEEEPVEETHQGSSSVQKVQMFVASSNRLEPTLTREVNTKNGDQKRSVPMVTNGRSVSPDTTKPKDEIDSKVMDFLAELDAIDGPDTTSGDGGAGIDGEPLPPTPPTLPPEDDSDSAGCSSDEDKPPVEPSTDWQQCLDDGTQCYYYWHFVTNEVTWEIPPEYSQYLLQYKEYEEIMAKYEKEKPKRPERSRHKHKKKKRKKNRDPPPPSSVCESKTFGPELPQSSSQRKAKHGPSIPSPPPGPVHGPSLPSPPPGPVHGPSLPSPPGPVHGPSLPSPPPGPVHGPSLPSHPTGIVHDSVLPPPPSQKNYSVNPPLPPGPVYNPAPPSPPPYGEHTVNPPLPPAIPRPPSPQLPESSQSTNGPQAASHMVSTAFPIGSQVPPPPPPPVAIGPELPSSSSGMNQPANQDADDNSSLGEDVDEYIHRKLEEPVYSHYEFVNKKYEGPQPSALPTESTGVSLSVVNYEDEDEDEDLDLDIDDIDRELERALERKQAELQSKEVDSTPMKRKAPTTDPGVENGSQLKRFKADEDGVSSMPCDVVKSHLLKADIKRKVDTLAEVAELSGLVSDKLDFLEITRTGLSKLRILFIEIQTRTQDWREGGLLTEHFLRKLRDASEQLEQYETSAAPPGWSCHWDRKFKRYFYCNEVTDETQWDYPSEAAECVPTPLEGTGYHRDVPQTGYHGDVPQTGYHGDLQQMEGEQTVTTAVQGPSLEDQASISQTLSADMNCLHVPEEVGGPLTYPFGIGRLLAAPPPPPPPCEPDPPKSDSPCPVAGTDALTSDPTPKPRREPELSNDRALPDDVTEMVQVDLHDIDGVAMDISDNNEDDTQQNTQETQENNSRSLEASNMCVKVAHISAEPVFCADSTAAPEPSPAADCSPLQTDDPDPLGTQHDSPSQPPSASPQPSVTEGVTSDEPAQSEENVTPSMSPAPAPVTSTEGVSSQEGTASSSALSPAPVKEKKKKKDKSLVGGGLSMKKKNVTGLVQKWQKVQKEVEKEMAKQRKAAVLLEEELETQLNG